MTLNEAAAAGFDLQRVATVWSEYESYKLTDDFMGSGCIRLHSPDDKGKKTVEADERGLGTAIAYNRRK